MSGDATPWIAAEAGPEDKKHAPATLRNRDILCETLSKLLPDKGNILEIASGSGEHIVHFARAFPHLTFQPSDVSAAACRSIAAWAADSGVPNILPPLHFNVLDRTWPVRTADAILCINMVHIAPWSAAESLFYRSGRMLAADALLFFYGPFHREDVATAQSNLDFDASLKSRDLQWGLRTVADMDALARGNRFGAHQIIEMPANNIGLVYRRLPSV